MPDKSELMGKLCRRPVPRNFTVKELDQLMSQCGCRKFRGGRGSGIGYVHIATGRILQFDQPHPGKELYLYQVKKVIRFLSDIGEL